MIKNRFKAPAAVGTIVITLACFIAYSLLLRRPLFLCEYPLFYALNADLSVGEWLRSYWPGAGGWYRPTAFYTYFQVLTQWVSWHDFFAIRLVAIGHMVVLGWAVMRFGLVLWPGHPRIAMIGGVVAAIHPIQGMQVVDLIHFDTIYQTALILLGAWFLSPDRPTLLGRVASLTLALFLWFIALTSKEPSIALPGWLAVVGLLAWLGRKDGGQALKISRSKWLVAGVITATAVALLFFRLNAMNFSGQGAYRVSPDLAHISTNALAGGLWLLHLFVVDSPSWAGFSQNINGWASTLCGVVCVLLAGIVSWRLLRGNPRDRVRLWVLLGWAVAFFVIPVYSGGRPWHLGPSLAAVALMLGFALDFLVGRIQPVRRQTLTLLGLGLVFATLSAQNMLDDRRFRHNPQEWVLAALNAPPIAGEQLEADATIVYEAGDEGTQWALGMGHLWAFVYLRPDLDERPIEQLSTLSIEQAQALLERPHLHYFMLELYPEPRWHDRPDLLRASLQAKVKADAASTLQINFADAILNSVVTQGLGGAEAWGRWNDGPETRLRLRAPDQLAAAPRWSFAITASPFLPSQRRPFTLTVEVGGEAVLQRTVAYPTDATVIDLAWTQPRPEIEDGHSFEIVLRYSSLVSPAELGLSGDRRSLALGLRTLEIRPAAHETTPAGPRMP